MEINYFPFLNLTGLIKKQDILLKTSGDVAGITKWMTLDVSNENEWGMTSFEEYTFPSNKEEPTIIDVSNSINI